MDSMSYTKMQLDPRYAAAKAMMQEGSSTRPAQGGPLEALARALQGSLGGYMAGKVGKSLEDQQKTSTEAMAKALQSGDYNSMAAALSESGNPDLMQEVVKQRIKDFGDQKTQGIVPGSSVQSWYLNTLLQGDPSSPEYAVAHALATEPQFRQVRNPDGSQSLAEFTPNLPVRPPVTAKPQLPVPGSGVTPTQATGGSSPIPPTPAGATPNLNTDRTNVNVITTGAPGAQSNTARDNMSKFDSSIDALMRYRQKLVENGTGLRELVGMSSPLMTDYTDLFMGLKDINTLGALQAGDTEQLQKLVKDPSTFSGYMSGDDNLLEQLDNATNMLHDRYNNYGKQFPGVKGKYTGAKFIDGQWMVKDPTTGKVMIVR